MPTVSAHVAITLAQHVDHVFGVMGNGNAWFLDALERETPATFTAAAPRSRCRRRRGCLSPRVGAPRRGHHNLRRRIHQHAHRTRRSGAGARAARAGRRRRADVGPAPLGCRPDRPRVGGRRAHVHRGTNGCRCHHGHRHRARPRPTACRPCWRFPMTWPRLDAGDVPPAPQPRLPEALAPAGPFAPRGDRRTRPHTRVGRTADAAGGTWRVGLRRR